MRLSQSADRTGLVLGNRYRLLALIGSGVSACVYQADDRVLGRRVAVKILHDGLADDERFLRRFRAEARAAAALNHPHVMAVYDWGEEALSVMTGRRRIPFLITEYLGGGSLRALLATGARLSRAQALQVGLEAVRGLEYAHRHGLVHRDVKPANLLFDEDARLRIADFGLARALAEAHWSEPAGSLAGTAKYASPEQARGLPLDGRSDVYSLALVLVEAVSGEVPFLKDTTLGTLMARLDQPLPIDDEVLGELAEPLRRAGEPAPEQRCDATELREALARLADASDAPDELELPGAELAALGGPIDDITAVVPRPIDEFDAAGERTDEVTLTTALPRSALPAAAPRPAGRPGRRFTGRRRPSQGPRPVPRAPAGAPLAQPGPAGSPGQTGSADSPGPADRAQTTSVSSSPDDPAAATSVQPLPSEAGDRPVVAPAPRWGVPAPAGEGTASAGSVSMRWAAVLVVAALIAGAIVGGAYWYTRVRTPTYDMPVLVGLTDDLVAERIAGREWVVQREDVYDDATEEGRILDQRPAKHTPWPHGEPIWIRVSKGPTPVPVPIDLPGKTLEDATAALEAAQLAAEVHERQFHETVPVGQIISVAPGTFEQVPKGDAVGLVVSDGPAPRTIPPNAVGRPADEVEAELLFGMLKPQRQEVYDEQAWPGAVIAIDPPAGSQVPRSTTVTLTVSKGMLRVPNLEGRSVAEAAEQLSAMGLVPEVQGLALAPVSGTSPPAGTAVRPGVRVIIRTEY